MSPQEYPKASGAPALSATLLRSAVANHTGLLLLLGTILPQCEAAQTRRLGGPTPPIPRPNHPTDPTDHTFHPTPSTDPLLNPIADIVADATAQCLFFFSLSTQTSALCNTVVRPLSGHGGRTGPAGQRDRRAILCRAAPALRDLPAWLCELAGHPCAQGGLIACTAAAAATAATAAIAQHDNRQTLTAEPPESTMCRTAPTGAQPLLCQAVPHLLCPPQFVKIALKTTRQLPTLSTMRVRQYMHAVHTYVCKGQSGDLWGTVR